MPRRATPVLLAGALALWVAACASSTPLAERDLFAPEPAPASALAPVASASATPAVASSPAPASSAAEPAASPLPAVPPPQAYALEIVAALTQRLTPLAAARDATATARSILVADAQTGQTLFALGADTPLVPASNTKLFTTAAALSLLGDDHRFRTRVLASAAPVDGAVDELFVLGEHDFTLGEPFGKADEGIAALARAIREAGVTRAARLRVAGEPLLVVDRFDELDVDAQRARFAGALARALTKAGVRVGPTRLEPGFAVPASFVPITERTSVPLSRACEPINQRSHNGFADALLRHLGLVKGGEATYAAGAKVELAWLVAEHGLAPPQVMLADGSGLSRRNTASAKAIVALLRQMADSASYRRSLAVAGELGTLKGRMGLPLTKGRLRGKTGTLEGVVATSGYLERADDGRLLVFALVMNGVRDGAAARRAQDRFLEVLAQPLPR